MSTERAISRKKSNCGKRLSWASVIVVKECNNKVNGKIRFVLLDKFINISNKFDKNQLTLNEDFV